LNIMQKHNPVHTGRIFFILCLSVLLAFCGYGRQQYETEVRAAVQGKLQAKPGTIVVVGMSVSNKTSVKNSYQSQVVLPQGWKLVTRDFPFDLQPNESDIRLLSFSIPLDASARPYEIRYIIRTASGREVIATVPIEIASVIQLELQVLEAPRFAPAGTKFVTTFLLTNKGNSATAIFLRFRSSQGYAVSADSVVQHFGSREARQIKLEVLPDAVTGKISHTLELEAISGQDSTIRVRTSSVVDVVSRAGRVAEEFYEYPLSVRLREVGQDGVFATQGEVYGYGSLSEQRTDRLEFLFRGPETQTKSVLGQRDEYRLNYRSKNFEIYGGDLSYALSPLTEYGRYATGAGARAAFGGFSGGGFYNETRWATPSQKEGGGFLNYDVLKGATVGINYLGKREQFNSDIATIRGLFAPLAGSNLDLEYGTGTKDGKRDEAYAARFDGNRQWISYDLRYVNAGSGFGGYYRDIDFLSASINFQATRNVRIESYARQENRNLLRDTAQYYAPQDKYYQLGVSYTDLVSLYYRHDMQEDRLDNPKYRRQEDALQGRLGYNFHNISIYANADYGSTQDQLLNQSSPYERLALYSSFKPVGSQNYSTSIEYSKERNLFTGENQERLSASLNAWILVGQSTIVQLNCFASRVNASPVQTYSLLEGSIEHVFPFNHKISLRGRQSIITPASPDKEVAFALEYSIPLGIPIKRITAVGQLRGMVKDERGNGVANVLLNAGEDAALTDGRGRFYFGALKPGSVYLSVDRASIGLDRIPIQSMPMEVVVRGGEETNIEIDVTRSATISGVVNLYGTKEQSLVDTTTSLVDLGGKSGIFLELTNGTEYNRRVSDNRGRFLFTDIRPGKWTLNVIGGDIPEYHQILPETTDINATPGDKKETTIQIRPKRRTIKILQEGAIIQEAPAKLEKKVEQPPPAKKTVLPCIISYDTQRKGYILQISSWVTKSKALRVARDAEKISGKKSFTVTAKVPSLGKRVRVFLRLFTTAKEAEAMCVKLNTIE
jgi:hypothetical protein